MCPFPPHRSSVTRRVSLFHQIDPDEARKGMSALGPHWVLRNVDAEALFKTARLEKNINNENEGHTEVCSDTIVNS